MALFLHEDVKQMLYNKFVVIIGDSVHRGIYKDLIALLQGNKFLCKNDLKIKGEETFMNDDLIEGGTKAAMTNGINYREVRQYLTDTHLIRFYFVTRVHNCYWQEVIFPDLCAEPKPDVIIMSSCLWDISRYGIRGMHQYKENLEKTFHTLTSLVSEECICIWDTALPVANKIKGGFLLPELSSLCDTLRLDVLEGNFYARQLAALYKIHVLDLNYFFRSLMAMQVPDGVHWNFRAHRRFTNILLSHLAKIWNLKLPYRQDVDVKKVQQRKKKNTKIPSAKKIQAVKKIFQQNHPATTSNISNSSSAVGWHYPPQGWYISQNPLYTNFSQTKIPSQLITQPLVGNVYQQIPSIHGIRQQQYIAPSMPHLAGRQAAYRWENPNQVVPNPYSYQQGNSTSYIDQYGGTPQNRYHWQHADGSARRQQRIMTDRQQEVIGAMANYASSQYRVQ